VIVTPIRCFVHFRSLLIVLFLCTVSHLRWLFKRLCSTLAHLPVRFRPDWRTWKQALWWRRQHVRPLSGQVYGMTQSRLALRLNLSTAPHGQERPPLQFATLARRVPVVELLAACQRVMSGVQFRSRAGGPPAASARSAQFEAFNFAAWQPHLSRTAAVGSAGCPSFGGQRSGVLGGGSLAFLANQGSRSHFSGPRQQSFGYSKFGSCRILQADADLSHVFGVTVSPRSNRVRIQIQWAACVA
jgi:hypothetical protein